MTRNNKRHVFGTGISVDEQGRWINRKSRLHTFVSPIAYKRNRQIRTEHALRLLDELRAEPTDLTPQERYDRLLGN